ncbi:MAG TPA: PilZ domain-containing protein [Thermodesulfobacteriota bacterium]|nr:PilZ domain-containing protein [Thermodesulfobacteriota bacterium]
MSAERFERAEEQYTEIITGDKMINTTLRSLIDSRTICKMEFPRTRYSWITILLDVRNEGRSFYLLIDKVAGFEEALINSPGQEISLEFMEKEGVPCRFRTRVIAPHNREIWSELPKVIYRIQRRQYFRIEALLGTEIHFQLPSSKAKEKWKVKNYSAGGVAFFIEKDPKFSVGDILSDVHLRVPAGNELIEFRIPEVTVRRIEPPSLHGGRTLCAVEFQKVSKETRDLLVSHVFKQQRVVIQKLGR